MIYSFLQLKENVRIDGIENLDSVSVYSPVFDYFYQFGSYSEFIVFKSVVSNSYLIKFQLYMMLSKIYIFNQFKNTKYSLRLILLQDTDKNSNDYENQIKQEVDDSGLTLMQILLTHGHLDHVGAAAELAQHYGVPGFGPEKEDEFWLQGLPAQSRMFGLEECQPLTPDRWLNEGDTISIGNVTLQVLHCPGHTPGHVVFFDDRAKLLISGDVIFKGGVGRSDFPRGDHNQLISSIKDKLLPLGDDVTFIPGHGPLSTLGYERLHNPFLQDEMPVW